MRTKASCDNCDKVRFLHHGYAPGGGETSQCWECIGSEPECDVCGEELEKDGRCLWCFGDPNIDLIRSQLQKMNQGNRELIAAVRTLSKEFLEPERDTRFDRSLSEALNIGDGTYRP